MNPRIRELAEQAGFHTELNWDHTDWHSAGHSPLFEKFAQLIVRECVQTLLDNTPEEFTNEAAEEDWDRGYDQAMRDCVHHIQEHFGVE